MILHENIAKARRHVGHLYHKHHGKVTFIEHMSHGCYFALVFLQGHGMYTYFAGALAVGVVIHIISGNGDDE